MLSSFHTSYEYELWLDHPDHGQGGNVVWRAWEAGRSLEERVGEEGREQDTAYDAYAVVRLWNNTASVEMLESWGHGAGSALMDHVRATHGDSVQYVLGEDALWPGARPFLERYRNRTGWWPANVCEAPMPTAVAQEMDQYLRAHKRLMRKGYVDVEGSEGVDSNIAERICSRLETLGESPTLLWVGPENDSDPLTYGALSASPQWNCHAACVNRGQVFDPAVGRRMALRDYLATAFTSPAQPAWDFPFAANYIGDLAQLVAEQSLRGTLG